MTPHHFVAVAIRLFAIWLALHAVQNFVITTGFLAEAPPGAAAIRYTVTALYLGASIYLWLFPLSLAKSLMPSTGADTKLALSAREALTVGCVILGLSVVVLRGLPALISYAVVVATYVSQGVPVNAIETDRHLDAIIGLIETWIGALLLFKARLVTAKALPSS